MAKSQNGWIAGDTGALDRGFSVAGVTFPGGVRRGDVSDVLGYVAEQVHARVEPLVPGWCWGYNHRPVTGGGSLSNHASGTAIDVNAPKHPYGKRDTFTPAQRGAIRQILAEVGGAVRWGGDYTGNRDDMHFEINVSAARVAEVAARLRTSSPVGKSPEAQEESEPMILEASTDRTIVIPTHGRGQLFIFSSMGDGVEIIEMFGIGDTVPGTSGGNITFRLGEPGKHVGRIDSDRPGPIVIPEAGRTRGVVLRYACSRDFTVDAA
jgi:hypothetical protein